LYAWIVLRNMESQWRKRKKMYDRWRLRYEQDPLATFFKLLDSFVNITKEFERLKRKYETLQKERNRLAESCNGYAVKCGFQNQYVKSKCQNGLRWIKDLL